MTEVRLGASVTVSALEMHADGKMLQTSTTLGLVGMSGTNTADVTALPSPFVQSGSSVTPRSARPATRPCFAISSILLLTSALPAQASVKFGQRVGGKSARDGPLRASAISQSVPEFPGYYKFSIYMRIA
jgi:hypothetical protein